MRFREFNTGQAAAQLSLLFDIESVFSRRGRKVSSYEDENSLLFPFNGMNTEYTENIYSALSSRSFRRVISFIANREAPVNFSELKDNFSSLEDKKLQEIVNESIKLKILQCVSEKQYIPLPGRFGVGFGSTLEWFIAACFEREFSCMAYWGVKLEEVELGGDYDVILYREGKLGYVECKSTKFSNITREEISQFLKRERILAPNFSIFLADDVSREKLDALVEYALEQRTEYEFEVPGMMDTQIELEKEEYKNFIRLIPINCFFITSEDSIVKRLREILQFLTIVYDRPMPFENIAAKKEFEKRD